MPKLPKPYYLLICIVFLGYSIIPMHGNERQEAMYLLDVGQGDSILVTSQEGHTILIDGGYDERSVTELKKVLDADTRYLDLVILSHADADHITGLLDVLDRYEVGAVLATGRSKESKVYASLSARIQNKEIPYVALKEGDKIRAGSITLSTLAPSAQEVLADATNEASLVFNMKGETMTALLTGDISHGVEERIADEYRGSVDVLKVAHHGSKHSSSDVFLRQFPPRTAVVSSGENRYGHPSEEALERISVYTPFIYRTDRLGTFRITKEDGHIIVATQKFCKNNCSVVK